MHIYDEEIDNLRPADQIWNNVFSVIEKAGCSESIPRQDVKTRYADFIQEGDPYAIVRLSYIVDGLSAGQTAITAPFSNDQAMHTGIFFDTKQFDSYPIVKNHDSHIPKKLSPNDEFEIEQLISNVKSGDLSSVNYAGEVWSVDRFAELNQTDGCVIEISKTERTISLTAKKNPKLYLDIDLRTGLRIVREKRQISNRRIENYFCAMPLKRIGISELSYEQSIIEA